MDLYNNIANNLSKNGINLATGDIYDLMAIWKQWYRGSVNDFHYYTETINGINKKSERLTMNMAKKVCEDLSKLLWTEKTQINLSTKKATKQLWSVLDSKINSFTVNFPIFLEKTLASGNGALIEYTLNGETVIDYVEGDVLIPYKFTNSFINGLITISRFTEGIDENKTYYTHITYHEFERDEYYIFHELYQSKAENELGTEINFKSMYPNIVNPFKIKTKFPRFQILKPNLVNNFDTQSPLGISIFANSIDRLKAIDIKYDSFTQEFILGKKRVVVDSTALKARMEYDENTGGSRLVQYFDSDDKVFVGINGNEGQPAKEIDFNLRAQEHIDSINAELNWLSENIGLGSNFYKFDGVSTKTATEVISENSQAFRTREHHQILVNDVIYELIYAICEMEEIKTNSITIIPDDSIIEDKTSQKIQAQTEVSANLRSKFNYLTEIRGLSDEEAIKELETITEEKQSNSELFGFNNIEEE